MNFLKKKTSKTPVQSPHLQRDMFHRFGRDHYLDWATMLVVVFIGTIVLVAMGGYVYFNMDHRLSDASTLDTAKKPETINEETLRRIIERFAARAAERAVLLKGYGGFGDPSL